jgi:hypothetical protein
VSPTKAVEKVLPDLESADAFTRLEAEKSLLSFTRRDFGFRWDGPDEDRAKALARVRSWLADRKKTEGSRSRAARRAAATGAAAMELAQLKGLDPAAVQKHIQEFLAHSPVMTAAGRPACQACSRRPATVEIVDIAESRARKVRRLCEPCAAKGG